MAPRISVIVPVHNVEKYIDRCVRSLIAQTIFADLEIILVENGSSDNSYEKCRAYAADYPNIKCVKNEKTGLSEARNFGLEFASASVVGFIDSDDYVDSDMFERLLDAKNQAGADIAYANFCLECEGRQTEYPFEDTGKVIVRKPAEVAYDILLEKSTSAACVRIYDRTFFNSRKFPENKYYEDHSTVYRWMSEMAVIVHVDKPFYHYCLRGDSITQTVSVDIRKQYDFFEAEVNRLKFVLGNTDFSEAQKKELALHILGVTYNWLLGVARSAKKDVQSTEFVGRMRHMFLEATNIPMRYLGWKYFKRRQKIRYGWAFIAGKKSR